MKKKSLLMLVALGLLTSTFTMANFNGTETVHNAPRKVCFSAYILDDNGDRIGYTVFDCDTGVGITVYY